jgi:hypothetical protein
MKSFLPAYRIAHHLLPRRGCLVNARVSAQ